MIDFIKAIYQRLTSEEAATAYRDGGALPCRAVMNYSGQYLSMENYEAFPCPCVLLQYSLDPAGDDGKRRTLTLTLHLCYERVLDDSSLSSALDKALEYHRFNEVTHQLVAGMQTERTGALKWIGEEQQPEDAIVSVHIARYTASYNGRNDARPVYDFTEEEDAGAEVTGGLREKYDWT